MIVGPHSTKLPQCDTESDQLGVPSRCDKNKLTSRGIRSITDHCSHALWTLRLGPEP